MLENYFKIAVRNLLRNKGFSFINILGLAIGMASSILIFLWIGNELGMDRFHEKKDRLYVANNRDKFDGKFWAWSTTSKPLAPALKQEYPDVEDAVRVNDVNFLFTAGEKHLNVNGVITDPGFLNMFSFPLLHGNAGSALNNISNIVLTQKLAKKLFGNQDAMGKTLRVDSTDYFTVTGVMKDLPNNTHFNFEYLLPWAYLVKIGAADSSWGNNSVKTFVLLKPSVTQSAFDAKIQNITITHSKQTDKATTKVFTQLLNDAWLYSRSENGIYTGGRIERVRLFSIIAIFILLIACINFMNLSTARSEKRAKEVGIRKAIGAQKKLLVIQFIGESVLLSLLAGIIAVGLVQLSLHSFNQLVDKQLYIDFANPLYWLFALVFILFTGILAGSYPAFCLSAYQPVKVLKGTFKAENALVTPRKVLVVLQFTFAIVLIICTIIVQRQIKYAGERDAGYSRNNLVFTNLVGETTKNFDLIKTELLESGAAAAVTKSMSPITQRYSDGWGYSWPGSTEEDEKVDFIRMASDADFVKTMNVKLLEGRDIDIKAHPSDSTAMLLNETAVKVMRLKDPIGQIVKGDGESWNIVGVVKDFIFESPYQKVSQLVVLGPRSWFNVMHVRLNPAKPVAQSVAAMEQIFKKYNPQYPFEYKFADDEYATKFDDEKRIGTLSALFAGLTIFISCLGLFGLATYMAENRVKEIGVRKALGASVTGITILLSGDFLKLVIISFCIATPVAWWAMHYWLNAYTYRISIQWQVFALTGLLSVVIALCTVSYQAIKAAIANPIKSLRAD
jgi:putative ABC transport system permease protein